MGRLIGGLVMLALYVCLGTVLAACAAYGYLSLQGFLSPTKLAEIKAVMFDFTPESVKAAKRSAVEVPVPTVEQVARAKAAQMRDVELREQSLRSRADQLRIERAQFVDEVAKFELRKKQFETELASLREESQSTGADNARQILESIKPKQAKEQLVKMIEAGAMDAAVAMLATMPPTKRSKVISEFKTADENKLLAEILRRIREADPEVSTIEATQANAGGK